MVIRGIMLVSLWAFLFAGNIHADDLPTLPSNKASVVLPLLYQISSKDSPTSVLERIRRVLGEPNGEAGGPRRNFWETFQFELDDKTQIEGGWRTNYETGVILHMTVTVHAPNSEPKVLYSN
jgi:hypothetical protein